MIPRDVGAIVRPAFRISTLARRYCMACTHDARSRVRAGRQVALLTMALAAPVLGCASGGASGIARTGSAAPGTLVAIFAHPDDETIASPALAHYAREGTKVY